MDGRMLSLSDLAVGQRYVSGSRPVAADEIKRYAAEYDPQVFHLDDEGAKATFFGGLAASGWLTAGITMRLIVESFPVAGGIVGSGGEIQWPKPVRPGDELTVETEILSITPSRSRPGRASVQARCLTRNQDGDVVQSFTPRLVVTS